MTKRILKNLLYMAIDIGSVASIAFVMFLISMFL